MGSATDLGDAEFEAGFVTAQIITHQLGLPVLQEVASMLTGAAGAELYASGQHTFLTPTPKAIVSTLGRAPLTAQADTNA